MIAACISVPKRRHYVEELRSLIEPSVDRFVNFEDTEYVGPWPNMVRMYRLLDDAPKGCPVLMMTDDAITVPGWRDCWEEVHARAKSQRYTLFGRQRHIFKPENIERGYVTGCFPRSFYDQAAIFIDQPGFIGAVLNWWELAGKRIPALAKRLGTRPGRRSLDVVIQEYMVANDVDWTITTPSIFDHRPGPSTLSNSIGQSPCYIGNL